MCPYEPPTPRLTVGVLARISVLLILLAFILAVLAYAVATYGLAFFLVGWYAWVLIGALAIFQLVVFLQKNRFGVYADGIAPPYKPLGARPARRFVVDRGEMESMRFDEIADPSATAADRALYFACEIRLRSGRCIRFPSHGGFRSLHRQVRSDREVLEAREALRTFAERNGLLRK